MKNKFLKFTFLLFMFVITLNTTFAALGNGINKGVLDDVTSEDESIFTAFKTPINNVFGTILTILKVVAVAGIMITGVKYMYAGPSDRGQIKQSLIYIIIGTILVFGVEVVVNLITGAWNNAI